MERKNYMMDTEDLAALRAQMPFLSEAILIRASVKAALRLSKEEFSELCLKAVVRVGRPRKGENQGEQKDIKS